MAKANFDPSDDRFIRGIIRRKNLARSSGARTRRVDAANRRWVDALASRLIHPQTKQTNSPQRRKLLRPGARSRLPENGQRVVGG